VARFVFNKDINDRANALKSFVMLIVMNKD
jgi:hypothetical protein